MQNLFASFPCLRMLTVRAACSWICGLFVILCVAGSKLCQSQYLWNCFNQEDYFANAGECQYCCQYCCQYSCHYCCQYLHAVLLSVLLSVPACCTVAVQLSVLLSVPACCTVAVQLSVLLLVPACCTVAVLLSVTSKAKCKAVPLQAWTGPEITRTLKLPGFKIFRT